MLHVREERIDVAQKAGFYDEGFDCDTSTILEDATPGEVYRYAREQYGRCTSKIYREQNDGPPMHTGWVFVKREKYEDTQETFLCETWVTLYERDACGECTKPRLTAFAIGG